MDFSILSSVLTSQTAFLAAIGFGTLIAVFGIGRALKEKNAAAAGRMAPGGTVNVVGPANAQILEENSASGLGEAMGPKSKEERFAVQMALARAGFRGAGAVAGYYMVRVILGLGLPVLFLLLLTYSNLPTSPGWLSAAMAQLSAIAITQIACVLCAIGFFGPGVWLKGRIAERQQAIEEAFPNALDLIQIAVEAGLGFDQALMRVASEIRSVAPELAEEIISAENEIQAGRDRDRALLRMARRTGVDEVSSFVNVVLQSARFGTPMSDALKTYAEEMRISRELKAQEKANKLPVQMSAVMASLMLPAILMMTLGPVVIRYIHFFANNPAAG
ncbi:MAG: type II secretion system F family protein [Pseudomonadota bacterium]